MHVGGHGMGAEEFVRVFSWLRLHEIIWKSNSWWAGVSLSVPLSSWAL